MGIVCEGYGLNLRWKDPLSTDQGPDARTGLQENNTGSAPAFPTPVSVSSDSQLSTVFTAPTTGSAGNSLKEAGPFGSFNVADSHQHASAGLNAPSQIPSMAFAPTDPLPDLDYSLQWADLFELDFDGVAPIDTLPLGNMFAPLAGINTDGSLQQTMTNSHNPADLEAAEVPHDILLDAQHLLKHFQDQVIPAMAGLPYTKKSPLRILNLASATQTLAEMTFLKREWVSHARLANFYAVLACSAHHLGSTPANALSWDVNYSRNIMDTTYVLAGKHFQASLKNECSGPAKAKYKDQLMASISLLSIALSAGYQKDARWYMVEAERLVRTRGLAKREISRKARLLHHVYTWVRIIGESTYVLHDYASYGNLAGQIPNSTPEVLTSIDAEPTPLDATSRLDDFLRLDPHNETLTMQDSKEHATGLTDIHLEDPRQSQATMYLEIYGLPETWLSLVSQSTRLANVMDVSRVGGRDFPPWFHRATQNRAERLESMVCTFAAKQPESASTTPHYHMLGALNAALVIFFYRRIRNVNPWILRTYVRDVVDALAAFDACLQSQSIPGPGTGWPAFIAGCEAMSQADRAALVGWLDNAHLQTGLRGYQTATEVMRGVWQTRDEATTSPQTASLAGEQILITCSWVNACKKDSLWAMLC